MAEEALSIKKHWRLVQPGILCHLMEAFYGGIVRTWFFPSSRFFMHNREGSSQRLA